MIRKLGALRDAPGTERGEPLEKLIATRIALPQLPVLVDMRSIVSTIPDQGNENSCVGHALAQAIRVRSAYMGRVVDPSAKAIYAVARKLESPDAAYLPDEGSYPEKAFEGVDIVGVCARERWPDRVDPTQPVPLDVLEAGRFAMMSGEYAIPTGRGCVDAIKRALAAGHPVFWTRDVGHTYMALNATSYRYVGDREETGGHAGCLVGYDPFGAWDAGSYGRGHGANGFTHNAWDFIRSGAVHKFKVITTALVEVQ